MTSPTGGSSEQAIKTGIASKGIYYIADDHHASSQSCFYYTLEFVNWKFWEPTFLFV